MPNIFSCLFCCFSWFVSQSPVPHSTSLPRDVVSDRAASQVAFLSRNTPGPLLDDSVSDSGLSEDRKIEIDAWIADVLKESKGGRAIALPASLDAKNELLPHGVGFRSQSLAYKALCREKGELHSSLIKDDAEGV